MDREKLKDIVESRTFQLFIAGVICLNAIGIGCETANPPYEAHIVLASIDFICLLVYIIEAAMKLKVYGLAYFKDGWNIFDFSIIVVSLIVLVLAILQLAIPVPVQIARTIRVLRIVRVFKLVSIFSRLRFIVEAIGRSIPGVLWTCLLLFIVMYVFDVTGVFAFGEKFPVLFGDLAAGLLTMFQVLTLEGWPEIARPIIEVYPFAWLFFVPFIVLTSFIMLNIIVGIILDTIEEARQARRIEPGATDVQLAVELEELEKQIDTVQRLLDKANLEKQYLKKNLDEAEDKPEDASQGKPEDASQGKTLDQSGDASQGKSQDQSWDTSRGESQDDSRNG